MNDTSSSDLLRAGREHHTAGRLEEAAESYRRAGELDASVEARLNLGIVLCDLGRVEEATDVLGQLVVDHPDSAAGWVQLARAIEPQGFAWEAHQAIAKALQMMPDAGTLVDASGVLLKLQDTAAAESASRRAVKMSPQSASAWIQLAHVLIDKGDKADAAAAYRQALIHEPQNAVATYILAALDAEAGAGGGSVTPKAAPPAYVRALFDGYAERFDGALVGSLKYQTPQKLDRMFSQWRECLGANAITPMDILDAGCGTGLCGVWLSKYRGCLIGVDLSRGMIARAHYTGVYDELITGEVAEELEKRPASFDLIVAADVFVYIGDLARVFTAAAAALRHGGTFLFSVEATADADYLLLPTQRFAHSLAYLQRLAAANTLKVRVMEEAVLHLEKGSDVRGYLMLTEKSPLV